MKNQLERINEAAFTAYGMKEGNIVYIDEVERGLECGCECPGCGSALVAKKGDMKVHHFAHHDGKNIDSCNESILHKLSKQIIEEKLCIGMPEVSLEVEQFDITGGSHKKFFNDKKYTLLLDRVLAEQSAGEFRPDLTCFASDEVIHIEIVVTNEVSPNKLEKVKEAGISMLSIDMSGFSPMDDLDTLTQAVLYDAPRYWVYHPDYELVKADLGNELTVDVNLINERICNLVMTEYDLVERSNNLPKTASLTPKPNQVLLLGYSSAYGYSRKKGRDFDCSLLMVGKEINGYSSTNYTVRSNNGYEIEKLSFDETIIPKLETMNFPCIVELELKMTIIYGRPQMVVSGIA